MHDNQKIFSDQEQVRRQKLKQLQTNNQDPYLIENVQVSNTIQNIVATYKSYSLENLLELKEEFKITGRVIAIRQTFMVLKDGSDTLQIYFNKKKLDQELIENIQKLIDLGDVLLVRGNLFLTKMGELTLNVVYYQLLAKCLHPLPEKFHGFKDQDLRLRKRYLDAIVNDQLLKNFTMRSKIIGWLREYLNKEEYLEVETPILHPIAGGASARPFVTFHNTLKQEFYLRIAPELPLKKLIVAGFKKVYEIGRVFRNEGMDSTHNPEFTALEIYTAYDGLHETMDLCEKLFQNLIKKTNITNVVWNKHTINLDQPIKRVAMHELVEKYTGVNFYKQIVSLEEATQLADKFHIQLLAHEKTIGHIFNKLFETLCESELIQPTFVYGHHKDVSPLAKNDPQNFAFTLRFEFFIGEKEFANGFAELNNPIEQLARFEKQIIEAKMGNDEANQLDYEFVDALEYGLVPTGGLGIGIDRLVMLLTQSENIRDVIFFPHVRKEQK